MDCNNHLKIFHVEKIPTLLAIQSVVNIPELQVNIHFSNIEYNYLITFSTTQLHGRTREQRYTKAADWEYIDQCAQLSDPIPFFGMGTLLFTTLHPMF